MVGHFFRRTLLKCLVILASGLSVATFSTASAQTQQEEIAIGLSKSTTIRFKVDITSIDKTFSDNAVNLDSLVSWINTLSNKQNVTINNISIFATASPEGGYAHNIYLAKQRAKVVSDYITKHTSINPSLIDSKSIGPDFDGLRRLVDSVSFDYKNKVISILDNTPLFIYKNGKIVDGKQKQLMDLAGGKPWFWMQSNLYSKLRRTEVVIDYTVLQTKLSNQKDNFLQSYHVLPTAKPLVIKGIHLLPPSQLTVNQGVEAKSAEVVPSIEIREQGIEDVEPSIEEAQPSIEKEPRIEEVLPSIEEEPQIAVEPSIAEEEPLVKVFDAKIALGTNALYSLVMTPNIFAEIPVSKHLSLGLNYTFPWFVWGDNTRSYEILHLDLFARYYFKPVQPLTAWFIGLNAGGAYYDLQPSSKGVQGEASVISIEAGYSKALSERWRLTISAGAGWMGTAYRRYDAVNSTYTHLVQKYSAYYYYFGPTRFNIGFAYVFGSKSVKANSKETNVNKKP